MCQIVCYISKLLGVPDMHITTYQRAASVLRGFLTPFEAKI